MNIKVGDLVKASVDTVAVNGCGDQILAGVTYVVVKVFLKNLGTNTSYALVVHTDWDLTSGWTNHLFEKIGDLADLTKLEVALFGLEDYLNKTKVKSNKTDKLNKEKT